ncbi:hypothetical protein C5O80_02845 [Burkholderia sp. SRS-46]|nr:hypothetical protein C5O80_02845 [Burkholderia sp. SRS-46]
MWGRLHWLDHRTQQPFGLAPTHVQRTAQHQGRLDRQSRIARLAARRGTPRCLPLRERLRRDPQRQTSRLRRLAPYLGQFVMRCTIFGM